MLLVLVTTYLLIRKYYFYLHHRLIHLVYHYLLYVQIRKRRIRLQNNSRIMNQTNSRQAEKRKLKMIFSIFIIYFLGHLPSSFYHLLPSGTRSYLKYYAKIFLAISYSTSFFIYFFFDKNFNSVILNKFKCYQSNQ
jgi:hypothetical protein